MKAIATLTYLLCNILSQSAEVGEIYSKNCASCHGTNMEGGVGGSLIDGEWKHGSSDEEIYRSIAKGNIPLGMIPWEDTLSSDQIRSLVIYLREKEKENLSKAKKFPKPETDKVTQTELENYRMQTLIEEGLNSPWAIAFLPDGRKLVTEKAGKLRIISSDGKLDPKAIEGTPETIQHGQGGLLEVAIHPDYSSNGWIYLGFSDGTRTKNNNQKEEVRCITSVVRGRIKDHKWVDQEWIFRADPKFRSGAGVHFGTRFVLDKGYIYFIIGERGGMMEVQDLTRPNGKIHRLHDDGRIPNDNPFLKTKDAIPSIWTYGHRNPQGLTIDPRDGSIYSTEHGPRGGDELNLILPARNYGWPIVTLGINYNGTPMTYTDLTGKRHPSITEKTGIEQPITHWVPSIAVCGLDFYTGDKFPHWKNDLLVGALAQKEIRRLRILNKKVISQEIIFKDLGRVRDVATSPDGYIYVILNGPDQLVRLLPAKK